MVFLIGVGLQPAETVTACVIAVSAAYGTGAQILQKNNAAGKRAIRLVRGHSAHGVELSFALLVLSQTYGCKERQNLRQTAYPSPHVHPLPSATGCIRNTMLSSFPPVFASIVRVCSAKPFARTTIS